jgi:hypothetical protein
VLPGKHPCPLQGCGNEKRKASAVYEAIERKISGMTFAGYTGYFGLPTKKGKTSCCVISFLGFAEGPESPASQQSSQFDVQKCEQKVSLEIHRILGLARFSA